MENLTRRELLRLGGTMVGVLAAPAWVGAGRAAGAAPQVVGAGVELTAGRSAIAVGGTTAELWTYNGSFPGPILRWREGERVRLRLVNRLDESTNLHLHGLHLPPSIDDPFLEVPPGSATTYEFTVPTGACGTYWYHPHMHGSVARQLFAGLAGAIVVEGPLDSSTLADAEEQVLVLKDLSVRNGQVAPHSPFDWLNGKEGELVLVNGTWRPRLAPTRSLVRLRLVNASNARYYRLLLEGHFLYQIATDGGLLAQPVRRRTLLLAPGERAEVLVRLRPHGEFRLLNLPYDRGSGMMHHGHGMGPAAPHSLVSSSGEPLLSIVAPGGTAYARIPATLAPIERLEPSADSPVRRVVLSEAMMGGFLINGRRFDPARDDMRGRLGAVELWEIENRGAMDHPFHLHTYPFQVLSTDGVPAELTAWKDVVNVRPGGRVRIAVPLRDFGGRTVFHCHIAEHEDLGMMGVLAV
jgi:FtsP/CotA-like multicopper oxidase with cupredoxin domain